MTASFSAPVLPALPGHLAQAVWRGSELASAPGAVVTSGFAALDAQLPGGGWPRQGLAEILQPPGAACEWRLLAPALAACAARGPVALVAPPLVVQASALLQLGLAPGQVIRIEAGSHAQRLWVAEQLVRSQGLGAVLAWLPQARSEALRRLQVQAQSCAAPVFVMRPLACAREASPAPLRVSVAPQGPWQLAVHVVKRKGAAHEAPLLLDALPPALAAVLPARLRREAVVEAEQAMAHEAAAPALAVRHRPDGLRRAVPAPSLKEVAHDGALGRVVARH